MKSLTYKNRTVRLPDECPDELFEKFKIFIDAFLHYQNRLSLNNWFVEFELYNDDNPDHKAEVGYIYTGCCATCYVPDTFLQNYPEQDLKRCAFHEVCELLLADIGAHLESMFSCEFITKMIHDVIRRLENLEFGVE